MREKESRIDHTAVARSPSEIAAIGIMLSMVCAVVPTSGPLLELDGEGTTAFRPSAMGNLGHSVRTVRPITPGTSRAPDCSEARYFDVLRVRPLGLEPRTCGLRVRCSAN